MNAVLEIYRVHCEFLGFNRKYCGYPPIEYHITQSLILHRTNITVLSGLGQGRPVGINQH